MSALIKMKPGNPNLINVDVISGCGVVEHNRECIIVVAAALAFVSVTDFSHVRFTQNGVGKSLVDPE